MPRKIGEYFNTSHAQLIVGSGGVHGDHSAIVRPKVSVGSDEVGQTHYTLALHVDLARSMGRSTKQQYVVIKDTKRTMLQSVESLTRRM